MSSKKVTKTLNLSADVLKAVDELGGSRSAQVDDILRKALLDESVGGVNVRFAKLVADLTEAHQDLKASLTRYDGAQIALNTYVATLLSNEGRGDEKGSQELSEGIEG